MSVDLRICGVALLDFAVVCIVFVTGFGDFRWVWW